MGDFSKSDERSAAQSMRYLISGEISVGEFCILGEPYGNIPLHIKGPATLRSHTVLYMGSTIGSNFITGHHVLVRHNCNIGNNVSVGSSSVLEFCVTIGNNVRIHSHAFIPEYTIIEDDVWIGPRITCTNAKYPKSPGVKHSLKGPVIKKGAIIGANATLLPGITIGENALVGAGSVVTKDIPRGEVWAGNPAKQINMKKNLPYEILESINMSK
jgi:acetyltransferase-like isoleucine patch superfamily enzyme